jgi:hypothetical protein
MKMLFVSALRIFTYKMPFVFTFFIFSLVNIGCCEAQSIVGKWKEIGGKNYFNARGVQKSGKEFILAAPQMGGQVLDIRADHRFTSSELMNWVPSQMELKGTWTISGDQLNTTLDVNQPDPKADPTKEAMINNYKLSWNGNNMILTLMLKSNPIMEKMEKTYVRF